MTKQKNNPVPLPFLLALFVLILGAIAMGISPIFVRHAEISSFASAFWRTGLALPGLALWAFYEKVSKPQAKLQAKLQLKSFPKEAKNQTLNQQMKSPATPIILAGLFFAGDLIFWHLAIQNTTIANATLLACLAPIWVVLFSSFIGEPIHKNTVFGLGLCLIGVFALVGDSFQLAPERLLGDIYGLITSVFFGLYFLSLRVARRSHMGSGTIIFFSTFITALVLFIVMLILSQTYWPESNKGVFALFSLAYISHIGGQGLLTIALGALSAVFSSLVIFIEAIAAALFAWFIEGEALNRFQLFGGISILHGIFIARPKVQNLGSVLIK